MTRIEELTANMSNKFAEMIDKEVENLLRQKREYETISKKVAEAFPEVERILADMSLKVIEFSYTRPREDKPTTQFYISLSLLPLSGKFRYMSERTKYDKLNEKGKKMAEKFPKEIVGNTISSVSVNPYSLQKSHNCERPYVLMEIYINL